MASPHVPGVKKLRLKMIHELLNPVQLTKEERRIRKLIDDCVRSLKAGSGLTRNAPCYQPWEPLISQNTVTSHRISAASHYSHP